MKDNYQTLFGQTLKKQINAMQESQELKKYSFLDYQVYPFKREVLYGKEQAKLKLSKKSFDLLLLLIKKQGHVVSKKEMTERVWPNQIVTDAALSKQITRLRNELLINRTSKTTIIETVRGVGIKLVPEVNRQNHIDVSNKSKKNLKNWGLYILIIALVFVLIITQFKTNDEIGSIDINESQTNQSVNMAIIPTNESHDWFDIGGTSYLNQRLQTHSGINALSFNSKWQENTSNKSVAIQLSESEGMDYVLEVSYAIKDKRYLVHLVLREKNGTMAKQSIQSESLTVLFNQIDAWVLNQLDINSQLKAGESNNFQTSDFVLETYLRGQEVAIHESYDKALKYFQTATNEDKDFLPAWVAMAEVEAKLGHQNKALALVEIIEKHNQFSHRLNEEMMVLKSKYLVGLNRLKEANQLIDESITLSESTNDYSSLIDAMTIKIQTLFNTGNINEKTIELIQRQISLLKNHKPDPYLLAIAYYNLAGTYHQLGQIDNAIMAIDECIELYTNANNLRGIVISHSLLARFYKDKGDSGRALLTLEKVERVYEQIDGIDEQQVYLQYKAENEIYFGLKNEALESIKKLEILNQKSDSLELKIVALSLRFELNRIHNEYQKSKAIVMQMQSILDSQTGGYPPIYNDLMLLYEMYITALMEAPNNAREKIASNTKTNPNIEVYFDAEVRMIEAIILTKENKNILAIEIYQDLLEHYVADNMIQDALYYAGYPLLDLLWEKDKSEFYRTLNYLDEMATFKYPLFKYKAKYLAFNKDYINAYLTMVELKSKANQFWTVDDQLILENYQSKSIQ